MDFGYFYTNPGRPSNWAKKVSTWLKWFAISAFTVLCIFAVVVNLCRLRGELFFNIAMAIAIVQMLAALFWMVLDTLPIAFALLMFNTHTFRTRQLELQHEFGQAAELHQFSLDLLKQADIWLGLRIERLKMTMVFGVGGVDKVAIFTLVAGAWAIWQSFPSTQPEWAQRIYLSGAAFLGGLAIGGMLINSIIKRLVYQKDLLTIAIAQLEE